MAREESFFDDLARGLADGSLSRGNHYDGDSHYHYDGDSHYHYDGDSHYHYDLFRPTEWGLLQHLR